jgi:putative ABC transport system permease protein
VTAILTLALKSLLNRKATAGLTVVSIALSVTLLLGVERIRTEAQNSFTSTISGTDLIVGARSSPVQLLLYSVFRIGHASNNISWESYLDIAAQPSIEWTIPISLGDSHRGYRVMGTTPDYFDYFRYGKKQLLEFVHGKPFSDLYDAVLGAEVARELGYKLGDPVVIAHGAGEVSFVEHGDKPFSVVGILKPTGTPVDRTVHVSLEAIEAIHVDWQDGVPMQGQTVSAEQARTMDLTPTQITAFMVKLNSPMAIFGVQRLVNNYREEPLTAILPGVALQQLWEITGVAEKALMAVSSFVVIVGMLGMLTALLTSLNERRREMAILRSIGARPLHVFILIIGEAMGITLLGISLGIVMLYGLLILAKPVVLSMFGFYLTVGAISGYEALLLGLIFLAGTIIGVVPGWRIYRYSLADGMTVRV